MEFGVTDLANFRRTEFFGALRKSEAVLYTQLPGTDDCPGVHHTNENACQVKTK